jgi:hypothetical protein
MQQLGLYAPGILGLGFAVVAFFSVRHIAANRPPMARPNTNADEEAQDRLPFDDPPPPEPEVRPLYERYREPAEH